jgi:hypothetical protein
LIEDAVLQLAIELMHGEKLQIDGSAMAVIVPDARYPGADGGLNPEFFVQFPGQCLFRALAGFNLAAGKLPLQGHRLIRAALANQNLAAANNKCGRYEAKRWAGRSRAGI